MSAGSWPVPTRLNLVLVALVTAAALLLFALAGRVQSGWPLALVALAFSFVGLTAYALLHEATHDNLHPDPRWNAWLGRLVGALFPVPFSLVRVTHQGHHLRNRTRFESFDVLEPGDPPLLTWLQWYGILLGFFWPLVPLGALLLALAPGLLRTRAFTRLRTASYLLSDVRAPQVRLIRLELLGIGAFFVAVLALLQWRWERLLLLYAAFAFNWSTRQYVGHAFAPREVLEGAFNLRAGRLTSALLLRGEHDLNHHRRPDVPWLHLPRLTRPGDPRPAYWRHYLRQWLGPRHHPDPPPESLQALPLSVHDEAAA